MFYPCSQSSYTNTITIFASSAKRYLLRIYISIFTINLDIYHDTKYIPTSKFLSKILSLSSKFLRGFTKGEHDASYDAF